MKIICGLHFALCILHASNEVFAIQTNGSNLDLHQNNIIWNYTYIFIIIIIIRVRFELAYEFQMMHVMCSALWIYFFLIQRIFPNEMIQKSWNFNLKWIFSRKKSFFYCYFHNTCWFCLFFTADEKMLHCADGASTPEA